FILPTYWEEPVPRNPAEGLPPPEIERLQFYRIYPGAISQATMGRRTETFDSSIDTSEAPQSSQVDASRRVPTGKLASPPLTVPAPTASEIGHLPAGAVVCTSCGSHNPSGMRFC